MGQVAKTLCGELIEYRKCIDVVQMWRPLGNKCDECEHELVFYDEDAITGTQIGPICRVSGVPEEREPGPWERRA